VNVNVESSCRFAMPVRFLQANYNKIQGGIVLTWGNPTNNYFQSVLIRRSLSGYPTSPTSGTFVYEGREEKTVDRNVSAGQRYFYTAFVRYQSTIFSPGVVASERVPTDGEIRGCMNPSASNYNRNATIDDGSCPGGGEIRGCMDPKATNYNPKATIDDGSCGSPFDFLPKVPEPSGLTWTLLFIQPKEAEKTFDRNNQVNIYGEKNLTIKFNAKVLPDVLKTVGITIYDPEDSTRSFSFLLKENADRSAYLATIEPLLKNGTYPISIFIINHQDQTIKKIDGKLIISGAKIAFSFGSLVPPLIALGLVPSIYELLLLIMRALSYLFGYRKKSKPWGTVYDSITKRPLDPAYITVLKDGKEVTSAITDIDGRFGFFLPAGVYNLQAKKTHYKFPSAQLAGRFNDEVYDNLYFGDSTTVKEGEVVNLNIPMDPLDFDWNEYVKNKKNYFRFYSRRERIKVWLLDSIFYLGFALSVGIFIAAPSLTNGIFCAFYVAFETFRVFWRYRHKAGQIILAATGEPLAFGLVRVYLPDSNQLVKIVPADELGRYYILVRPGTYYYTVEEKQIDGSYVKIYQSGLVELPKGVLTKKIIIK
ncbi:MAG: hypothetical protein NTV48_01775, partial [Candidatus Vogelbacteria bacterium]|nr:hypothetical protein [Candidatus Vogelbacteria bacterium]